MNQISKEKMPRYQLLSFSLMSLVVFIFSPIAHAEENLKWEDCLREAAKNHPDLIAAQEEVIQEQASRSIVISGNLPSIKATASAGSAESDSSGASNSFSYGASASQLLFDGFKTRNNINAARENVNAAAENFRYASATVRFRLREAFVALLKAQELVSLTEEIFKIRKSNLDLIELRYQSGTEHKGALLTARANVSQAEFEINQAKRNLESVQRQLVKELGRKEFSPLKVTGEFVVSDQALDKPDFEKIAVKNPSILKILAQKNAAAFDIKSSKGEFLPEVTLSGDIGRSAGKWPPHSDESSAGVKVSLPLFEGGSLVAGVAKAQSRYRQLDEQERSLKDGIVLNLEQNWDGLQDAVEQVKVQENFLRAAEERARIAQEQYSVGLITFDNWTIIDDDLVRSKKSFLNAEAAALLAEASWVQAKGEILEYEN